MFAAAKALIISKTDLLPYVDFSMTNAIANARRINPDLPVFELSARSREGLSGWYDWLRSEAAAARLSCEPAEGCQKSDNVLRPAAIPA
jgi:hydrogenase nickel incorporation protein HypB